MPKRKTSKSKTANKKIGVVKAAAPREGKGATIIELLRREGGATITDLTEATGWQKHSVRGFLAAVVRKKLGLDLQSSKRYDGQRLYQVAS